MGNETVLSRSQLDESGRTRTAEEPVEKADEDGSNREDKVSSYARPHKD